MTLRAGYLCQIMKN